MRQATLLLWIAIAALMLGCGTIKREAMEADTQLAVIAEGDINLEVQPILRKQMERPILTPQEEYRFDLSFAPDDSLKSYSRWQQVLLVGTLDSDDAVSKRIAKTLKGEVLAGVQSGEYTIFRKTDLWAKGQTVVFLVAQTKSSLIRWLQQNEHELYSVFSADRDARMKKQMFAMLEQKALADSLQKEHGWEMRLQHDYVEVASNRSPNFVRLRRMYPDRFLTVAWRIAG